MPIKIPSDLPAVATLESENIFLMFDEQAAMQDIRPLRILILNLMPTKVETEIQLLRLLSNNPLQTDIFFLQMATHESKTTSQDYLDKFYRTFEDVREQKFDGMIITGAPVEDIDFNDVDYWEELCCIMDWSKTNVTSTLHICWGAQAGLYHHYNIPKYEMEKKISGIYGHTVVVPDDQLMTGFDDLFYMPHSRHTETRSSDIYYNPHLHVVAQSDVSGVGIVVSEKYNHVFVTGHAEYDRYTLAYEYDRDMNRGLNPQIPENYFPDNDTKNDPVMTWKAHGNLLFSNWLNYYVYQRTPYDIEMIGKR